MELIIAAILAAFSFLIMGAYHLPENVFDMPRRASQKIAGDLPFDGKH